MNVYLGKATIAIWILGTLLSGCAAVMSLKAIHDCAVATSEQCKLIAVPLSISDSFTYDKKK
jgi:uncharacterized protein YceK